MREKPVHTSPDTEPFPSWEGGWERKNISPYTTLFFPTPKKTWPSKVFFPPFISEKCQLSLLLSPNYFLIQQVLKVELFSKSENIWKCFEPFRERAWNESSKQIFKLREGNPGCLGAPGYPSKIWVFPGFAWAPSHTLPSGHFWVGLETPKIIVFQAHPGPLELRIMAFLAPLLVPFLGLRRGPSKPLFWGLPGRFSKLSQGALSGPLRGSLIALK